MRTRAGQLAEGDGETFEDLEDWNEMGQTKLSGCRQQLVRCRGRKTLIALCR